MGKGEVLVVGGNNDFSAAYINGFSHRPVKSIDNFSTSFGWACDEEFSEKVLKEFQEADVVLLIYNWAEEASFVNLQSH